MKSGGRPSLWMLAMVGANSVMAGLAMGQVATPPPAAPAPTPQYVPPPAAPKPAPRAAPKPPAEGPAINNIPFEPLGERDKDGKLLPLAGPTEILALERNPTIGEATAQRLKPYLRERRATIEKVVIDNLDMVQQIESGAVERLDARKKDELMALTQMLRPLTGRGSMTADLRNRDLLTQVQAGVNQRITKRYQTDLIADAKARAKASGADEATEVTRALLGNNLDEVMFAYKGLLVETGKRLGGEGKKDEEYVALAKKHLEPMAREARQAELRKTVEMRPAAAPDEKPPTGGDLPPGRLSEEEIRAMQERQKKAQPQQPAPAKDPK